MKQVGEGKISVAHLQANYDLSLNLFPNNKFYTLPNWKDFTDDNFKFDENSRKSSKRVENTVGKREIVCSEQFLLFPECFQKTC